MSALAAVLAVGLSLTACSSSSGNASSGNASSSGGTAQIDFWTMPFASLKPEQVQALVDKYNASQSSVHVNLTLLQFSDGRNKILQAVSAGKAPDVFFVAPLDYSYVKAGALATAKQLGYTDADIAKFSSVAQAGVFNGNLYAIPLSLYADVLYVNKTVLDEYGQQIPTTWDELYNTAAAITTKSAAAGKPVTGFQVDGMDDHLNAINHSWPMFFDSAGGSMVSKDLTTSTENSPAGMQTLSYLKKFFDTGVTKVGVSSEKGFMNGSVALFMFSPGLISTIKASALKDQWTIATLPKGPVSQMSYVSSDSLVASASSKNLKAAGDFMKWIASPQNTTDYMKTGGIMPYKLDSLPDAVKQQVDGYISAEPMLQTEIQALDQANINAIRNESVGQSARWTAQSNYIVAALSGQVPADNALKQIDTAVNQAIK